MSFEEKKDLQHEEEPVRVVDRRRFHHMAEPGADLEPGDVEPRRRKPAFVEELEERLGAAEERLQETLSAHRRGKNEFEEMKARLDRDFIARVGEAKAKLLRRILDVADEMERAIEAAEQSGDDAEDPLVDGLRLIHKKLFSILTEEGVERLDLEGKPFDPEVAEAITVIPVEDPSEHDRVARVVQAGYQLGGKTLRPARVQVGRHSS